MTVAWLALLSVCLWAGFEFKGVAQMKRSAKAAHTFCASVKDGASSAEAQALASTHPAKKKLDISDAALRVDFGNGCTCNIAVADDKVTSKTAQCKR